LFIFLTIACSSCTRYLVPSNLGNDMVYQPRPMVADSIGSKITVHAGITGSGGISNEGTATLGYLSLNRGHTFKDFNFSYGLLGYYGNVIKNYIPSIIKSEPALPSFNKSTSGFGVRTSIGYHFTSERGSTDYS